MAELLNAEKVEEKSQRIAKKVLFVKNLPYDTKDEEFEKAFSDVGPIRKCFLIREKEGTKRCKGFGYVTFAIEEDAQKAKDSVKTLKGRSLTIAFSVKKPRTNRPEKKSEDRKMKTDDDDDDQDDDGDDNDEHERKKEDKDDLNNNKQNTKDTTITKKKRKPKSERSQPDSDSGRTVLLFGLPSTISSKELYKRCRKIGKIEQTSFPLEGREEVVGALTFSTPKEARKALLKLNDKTIKGNKVVAMLKSKENKNTSGKVSKRSRLIVRNLSFHCGKRLLEELFSQCNEKIEVNMPMAISGKRNKGFAFVQFPDVFSAAKALKEMNLKVVLGRPIAVDWAVSKEQFELTKESPGKGEGQEQTNGNNDSQTDDKESDEDDDDDDDEDRKKQKKSKDKFRKNKEDSEKDDDDEDDDDEDSDDDGDDDDDSDDDNKGDSDENEDSHDESVDDEHKKKHDRNTTKKASDVKEGLTLFIRNVNYDSSEKALYKLFKKYGELAYCKIVTDPVTEHSKGTAFVKYKSIQSVEKCLADGSKDSNDLTLHGHRLQVDIAVTPGKAEQLRQQDKTSKKDPKDKRNLYLAREGVIATGSEAAKDLTKADLLKRQKAEAEKKTKLQNPNYFVSTTRLCVRNLPLETTEAELKKVFSNAGAGHSQKPAIVKNVLIMRNKDRVDGSGKSRSLGFGFVEFVNHKDALAALRSTNNSPDVFGPNRRPIVEFSIENSLALKARQQRQQRSKVKQHQTDDGKERTMTNKERRLERNKQMREKKKEKRSRRHERKMENSNATSRLNDQPTKQLSTNSPKRQTSHMKNISNKQFSKNKSKKPFASQETQPSKSKVMPKGEPKSFHGKNVKSSPIAKVPNMANRDQTPGKRMNKRKATDLKEEKEFNSIVQKYKNKLFGDAGSTTAKRARWYE